MGKKIRKSLQNLGSGIIRSTAGVLTGGLSETAGGRKAAGAAEGILGEVTGVNADAADKAEGDALAARSAEGAAATAEENKLKNEARTREDQARVASGQRSKTLLTGSQGLDDDEDATTSRRTLSGRK